MDYDDNSHLAIEGAYATTSYKDSKSIVFREEEDFDLSNILNVLSDNEENFVLKDNNLIGIKNSPEFNTNKNSNSPTIRFARPYYKEQITFFTSIWICICKRNRHWKTYTAIPTTICN